jgi:hypothetical protein
VCVCVYVRPPVCDGADRPDCCIDEWVCKNICASICARGRAHSHANTLAEGPLARFVLKCRGFKHDCDGAGEQCLRGCMKAKSSTRWTWWTKASCAGTSSTQVTVSMYMCVGMHACVQYMLSNLLGSSLHWWLCCGQAVVVLLSIVCGNSCLVCVCAYLHVYTCVHGSISTSNKSVLCPRRLDLSWSSGHNMQSEYGQKTWCSCTKCQYCPYSIYHTY